jgi:excisionase family DNA binding protein
MSTTPLNLIDGGFITVKDASKQICISRSKLYQLMDSGRLKFLKEGRSRRISRIHLEAYVERNLHGGWNP